MWGGRAWGEEGGSWGGVDDLGGIDLGKGPLAVGRRAHEPAGGRGERSLERR